MSAFLIEKRKEWCEGAPLLRERWQIVECQGIVHHQEIIYSRRAVCDAANITMAVCDADKDQQSVSSASVAECDVWSTTDNNNRGQLVGENHNRKMSHFHCRATLEDFHCDATQALSVHKKKRNSFLAVIHYNRFMTRFFRQSIEADNSFVFRSCHLGARRSRLFPRFKTKRARPSSAIRHNQRRQN